MKNLYTKLLAVQKELKAIVKDETNPHFKSKYFTINSVIAELRPILNKVGLLVLQPLTDVNGRLQLQTSIIDPESGEIQVLSLDVPQDGNIQHTGANLTYLRRYALTSLFLIEGEEDDDANSVSIPVKIGENTKLGSNNMLIKSCKDCQKEYKTTYTWATQCTECYSKSKFNQKVDQPPF